MMHRYHWWVLIQVLIGCLLAGCLDGIRYKMPCRIPQQIQTSDLAGTWQLEYHNFLNADSDSTWITGTETLILLTNGTYVQAFDGPEQSYVGPPRDWRLITDEGDRAKLAMSGLRYYANGIEYSDGPLLLSLQMPDYLQYDKTYPVRTLRRAKTVIDYPTDGFVYLYPRYCLGKLVLLQMVSGPGDPDDLTVHNPVYAKIGE